MSRFLISVYILASFFGMGQVITYSDFGNLGDGLSGGLYPRALFYDTIDKKLYAGGQFTYADNKPVWGVAVWDGIKWDSLQGGFTKYPHVPALPTQASEFAWKIIRFQNKIYFAGAFDWVNGKNQYNLGVWNGNSWDYPLPQPLSSNSQIYDMVVYKDTLYVCGLFTMIGSIPCNYVAKFDGNNWMPVGDFSKFDKNSQGPAQMNCIEVYNNEIYVGGAFDDSTGTPRNIAKFDGTQWTNVGSGIRQGGITWVGALEVFNNELYIGGRFEKTIEIPGRNLVKWNGNNYQSFGSTDIYNGQVNQLKAYKNRLIIIGAFSYYGTLFANGFVYIDEIKECSVTGLDTFYNGNPIFFTVSEFINDSLIVGGLFKFFNGTDTVRDVAVMKNYEQYSTCLYTGISENFFENNPVRIYPNPAKDKLNIECEIIETDKIKLSISNSLGQIVYNLNELSQTQQIDISFLPGGVYFLNLQKGIEQKTIKLIKD